MFQGSISLYLTTVQMPPKTTWIFFYQHLTKWGQISQVNRKRECEFLGGPPHPGWRLGGMGTPELPAPSQWAGLVLSYPVSQPGWHSPGSSVMCSRVLQSSANIRVGRMKVSESVYSTAEVHTLHQRESLILSTPPSDIIKILLLQSLLKLVRCIKDHRSDICWIVIK